MTAFLDGFSYFSDPAWMTFSCSLQLVVTVLCSTIRSPFSCSHPCICYFTCLIFHSFWRFCIPIHFDHFIYIYYSAVFLTDSFRSIYFTGCGLDMCVCEANEYDRSWLIPSTYFPSTLKVCHIYQSYFIVN